jgi:hypothetical protein
VALVPGGRGVRAGITPYMTADGATFIFGRCGAEARYRRAWRSLRPHSLEGDSALSNAGFASKSGKLGTAFL